MKTLAIVTLVTFFLLFTAACAERACNACGPECSGACGTAMFRACCFNYNRKRSLQPVPAQLDRPEQDNSVILALDGPVPSVANSNGLKQAMWRARKSGCATDY
ncbi:hypothetical protein BIW11_02949 [Tropilaelaps mercedesae]|uniref:Uncharacterized protein n=1 Tax=Tropilaelaps mercedesae TaxID=418985 RepID=A0A1V9XUI9_9ACAR|nr:hypothetical protein BIW11_02949 [Tropilaelaps mercedesae]